MITIEEILKQTPLWAFNKAVSEYRLRFIWERLAPRLKPRVNNCEREYTIAMTALFNQFQTIEQELEAIKTVEKIAELKRLIKFYSKTKRDNSLFIKEFNACVDRLNELNTGVKKLAKMYKKIVNLYSA